ncbi:hypothetical protein BaRGS_00030402, partial [Batillaria attramentaria]
GPDAAGTNITGPSPFITNGTLSMTLTCETSTNPTPYYSWSGVRCDNGISDNTCIFTPPIEDDGKRATCEVTNPKKSEGGLVSVVFNINLSYDPLPVAIGAIAGGTVAALVVIIIIVVIACCCRGKRKDQDKENVDAKHNEGVVNPKFVEDGSGSGSNHDNDSGIEMNGGSSPLEMSPRQSDGAGYASLSDYPPSGQHSGEFRKKSARAAAYEVTSITSTGKVNIKTAAPQPNAYQDPWDIKKGDMAQAGAPGGPPTPHNVGPKGDEYAMISNPKNKTTIAVGPQGAKHGKGDNTQGSLVKAQGPEDAAASRGPPLSMTPHPLDTPGNQGDVTSSSGDTAASGSPIKNTSSPGDGADSYDHFQRDGHDPKSTSQGPDSHLHQSFLEILDLKNGYRPLDGDNGPDETEIVGPSVFIIFNGTQTLTLTCNTTVIPTPDYQWLGKDCENGNTENTCRYTPSTTDDGKSVVCVASNRKFSPWKRVRSDPYYFNLLCSPRPTEDSFSITRLNHSELTKEGLSFTVLAYPVPESFAYFHYASTVDVNRNPVGNQDMFETECGANEKSSPFVICTLKAVHISQEHLGVYSVELTNILGSMEYFFEVKIPVSSMAESSTANTAAVAGGVAGGIVVLAIVIVGAVFAWRRRYLRYERPIPRRSQNPHLYTDLQQGNGQQPSLNPDYADSQELSDQLQTSVNYANTEPRPDLSQKSDLDTYINVETRNTYEHIEAQPQAVSNVYNARHSPNQTAGVENIP